MAIKSSSPQGLVLLVLLVLQVVLTPSFLNSEGLKATRIQDSVVIKYESLVGVVKRDSRFLNRLDLLQKAGQYFKLVLKLI
jgi:hypothetical protein